jgi:hypothetical protein
MVYSQAEPVFIIEYYFAAKYFAAVCETFSSAYPDKKAWVRHHYTNWKQRIGTLEVFVCDECLLSDRMAEIITVLILSTTSAAAMAYGCKNSVLPLV